MHFSAHNRQETRPGQNECRKNVKPLILTGIIQFCPPTFALPRYYYYVLHTLSQHGVTPSH
jgi:hypothetical protein